MAFVIQDIDNQKYLKHTGNHEEDHPYYDVNSPDKAEKFSTFDHVSYVAFWYCDMFRNWRIIDLETNNIYVKEGRKFVLEG
ncbi:hypothetical protein [Metabacillus fastidiosus]|uniref:hypothetical protein n=1 Tax=Metabacillus fastidiosus TaxID=1458 RepID=UPI003D2C83C8